MQCQSPKTLIDFSNLIAGNWADLTTDTRFSFRFNLQDPSTGTLGIIQHRAKRPLILNISLQLQAGNAVLLVEKLEFELAIIGFYIKSLCIILSPGDVLHLLKRN